MIEIEMTIERNEVEQDVTAFFSQDIGDGTPEFCYAHDEDSADIELTDGEKEKGLERAYEQVRENEVNRAEHYAEDR